MAASTISSTVRRRSFPGTSAAAGGPPALNGNTFPQVFDPLGRTMFLGLTADF